MQKSRQQEAFMNARGKTIVVTGATGNQGGATARHLLADGWHVRALVRDDTAPAATALAAAGAELVRGDLDDPASVATAVRGAYGVYSVQSANPNELVQGTNVVDAAKAADVRHLVYSSVGGAESQNGFYREHGWGPIEKWQIEQYIRSRGVPATILRPAGFMEDFTSPDRFFQNGSLNVPWHDDLIVQLIAIDDIGAFTALAFADPAATSARPSRSPATGSPPPRSPTRSAPPPAAPSRTPRSRSRPCGNTPPKRPRSSPGPTSVTSIPT
jgi:uncharacterized protein YbjT (DUF2867 family)